MNPADAAAPVDVVPRPRRRGHPARHPTQAVQPAYGVPEYAERRRDTAGQTGVMGNPMVASAEKGERLFNAIVAKLAQLVMEMHHAPVRRYKEFGSHCP